MKLVFTKGSGKYDFMEVFRPGGEPERVECPKQRIIPHDMVHYAVEHTLQARGFLCRVKEGEQAGFQMQPGSMGSSLALKPPGLRGHPLAAPVKLNKRTPA
jgi:hypothetical protein